MIHDKITTTDRTLALRQDKYSELSDPFSVKSCSIICIKRMFIILFLYFEVPNKMKVRIKPWMFTFGI
jgi:hypothetical protein